MGSAWQAAEPCIWALGTGHWGRLATIELRKRAVNYSSNRLTTTSWLKLLLLVVHWQCNAALLELINENSIEDAQTVQAHAGEEVLQGKQNHTTQYGSVLGLTMEHVGDSPPDRLLMPLPGQRQLW